MDLSHWIERHAQFAPGAVAIRFEGASITYAELARRIAGAAAILAGRGVKRGDAVAWLGVNHPAVLVLLFACARLGAMLAPLNWRLAPPEIARMVADCAPKVVLVEKGFSGVLPGLGLEMLEAQADAIPEAEGCEDAPLLLCYTSGSTGRPKGVMVEHRNVVRWRRGRGELARVNAAMARERLAGSSTEALRHHNLTASDTAVRSEK